MPGYREIVLFGGEQDPRCILELESNDEFVSINIQIILFKRELISAQLCLSFALLSALFMSALSCQPKLAKLAHVS